MTHEQFSSPEARATRIEKRAPQIKDAFIKAYSALHPPTLVVALAEVQRQHLLNPLRNNQHTSDSLANAIGLTHSQVASDRVILSHTYDRASKEDNPTRVFARLGRERNTRFEASENAEIFHMTELGALITTWIATSNARFSLDIENLVHLFERPGSVHRPTILADRFSFLLNEWKQQQHTPLPVNMSTAIETVCKIYIDSEESRIQNKRYNTLLALRKSGFLSQGSSQQRRNPQITEAGISFVQEVLLPHLALCFDPSLIRDEERANGVFQPVRKLLYPRNQREIEESAMVISMAVQKIGKVALDIT